MTCDDVKPRLTAYLDGDLDADRGTVVRGHLRTCEGCRKIAEQEAALRDGLRALPTVDPPSHLWGNIQAQLAAAEVAESKRPAWKRLLAKWTPVLPRFAMGGVLAAAAVGVLWWRTHRVDEVQTRVVDNTPPKFESSHHVIAPITIGCNLDAPGTDVTEDLAGEPARVTGCYAQTANELAALAKDASWTDAQRTEFDGKVAQLRKAVDDASDERARQRAYRKLNRYMRQAITRDEVALAGGL